MIEELREKAEALGIKVDGRWKEAKLLQVIADASELPGAVAVDCVDELPASYEVIDIPHSDPDPDLVLAVQRISEMNAYALRIWNGQGSSELRTWRVERVKAGLIGQGYEDILEHLSLPNA